MADQQVEDAKDRFRARIRELRTQKGWSVAQAADGSGLTRQNWRKIESGEVGQPSLTSVLRIQRRFGLESIDLASYQAVSGAGRPGLEAFEAERAEPGDAQADGSPFAGRIADSVVPQIDVLDEDGWTGEENKIHAEIRKILGDPELDVAATAVRVPVFIGHSVALHIRTARDTSVAELEEALKSASGLEYRPADGSARHPMPLDVAGRDPVIVGRVRAVPGRPRGFALFLTSDNLRKGAALNAVQVAATLDPERFGRLLPPPH